MDYKALLKLWEPIFEKLGYREGKRNNWVAETPELIIILSPKVQDRDKDLYIDIGILFKKLYSSYSLDLLVAEDRDIGQGLYNILRDMGEWEYYLNNLFSYDPEINTDEEVKNNIEEIAMLFLTKVIPHIEQLDTYAWLVKNFSEETSWVPFLQYFRPSEEHNEDFDGILDMYYLQHRKKL